MGRVAIKITPGTSTDKLLPSSNLVKTNEHGEFEVQLPFSVSKRVKRINDVRLNWLEAVSRIAMRWPEYHLRMHSVWCRESMEFMFKDLSVVFQQSQNETTSPSFLHYARNYHIPSLQTLFPSLHCARPSRQPTLAESATPRLPIWVVFHSGLDNTIGPGHYGFLRGQRIPTIVTETQTPKASKHSSLLYTCATTITQPTLAESATPRLPYMVVIPLRPRPTNSTGNTRGHPSSFLAISFLRPRIGQRRPSYAGMGTGGYNKVLPRVGGRFGSDLGVGLDPAIIWVWVGACL
ncbi:hypothetical protein F3Y22_tig00117034pilonHSYRG00233 [Hibiscus syriacus]|uniref:Uncharacterized protein n=1 Tax=Hibiscus syriacus TaxID=106335 RepID=A0A6A2WBD9_HIBSY|nr:hypothetical protein F3Y22_tig00117034pilonHSYRG00233 [Hibiscus syriacus]